MIATIFFSLPQSEVDLYTAAALADVWGTPKTRNGRWVFSYETSEIETCLTSDPDCLVWTYWKRSGLRDDTEAAVGLEMAETVEESIGWRTQFDDHEATERAEYEAYLDSVEHAY